MKKKIFIIIGIIFLISILIIIKLKNTQTDSEKFANEYSISNNNVFVYKSLDEINKILKNGTGIVYLGFPECPWCLEYVKYLNEVAMSNNVESIYYCNIYEDRKNNTKEYLETVKLLSDYLNYDEEGNKKIYVPAVISVNNGSITGFDDETSYDTKNYETPQEYWENENADNLKNKLQEMFKTIDVTYCTTCN